MMVIAVPIVVGVAFGLVLLWFNSRKPYIRAQDLARSASWFALWMGTWGPQIWSRRKRWHAAAEIGLLGAAAMVPTITAAEARRRLDHAPDLSEDDRAEAELDGGTLKIPASAPRKEAVAEKGVDADRLHTGRMQRFALIEPPDPDQDKQP